MTTTAEIATAPNGSPRRLAGAAERWAELPTIVTGEDYLDSIRGRGTRFFLLGEEIEEPVDHPIIRPSINAVTATYDLRWREPELATAHSPLIGAPREPLPARHRERRGRGDAEHDAAPPRPAHRHLLPALRRHGRHQLLYSVTYDIDAEARHRLPRALHRASCAQRSARTLSSAAR